MRKALLLAAMLFICFSLTVQAQQGVDIVRKAYAKTLKIKNIEWTTTYKMKFLSDDDDDTSVSKGHVQFARIGNGRFLLHETNDTWGWESFLVPDSCVSIHPKDSTVSIFLKEDWPDTYFISSFSGNLSADAITNLKFEERGQGGIDHFYSTALSMYNNDEKEYEELLKEDENSWDIQLNRETDTLRLVIRKWDNIITFGEYFLVDEDRESQYTSFTFEDINYNPHIPLIQQRLYELPDYYTLTVKYPTRNDTLELGARIAWAGRYMDGDTVSSEDFAGKYALYKFTYRACGWCQKAIPMTNEIIKRFPDLAVVGLDPYDRDRPDKLREHIEKKGIEYPIVFISYADAKRLKVKGYPRFYLVNPEGKLIWQLGGYPRDHEEETIGEVGEMLKEDASQ